MVADDIWWFTTSLPDDGCGNNGDDVDALFDSWEFSMIVLSLSEDDDDDALHRPAFIDGCLWFLAREDGIIVVEQLEKACAKCNEWRDVEAAGNCEYRREK